MKALLVVDIQTDYFPDGAMELSGADAAGASAARLLSAFRSKAWPVFHVRHVSVRQGSTFFLPGTPGAEFHPLVAPRKDETVVTKHFPNSFRETQLLGLLREAGVRELVICGMMTHMFVDATVRAALDLGFGCTVAPGACAARDLMFQGRTIRGQTGPGRVPGGPWRGLLPPGLHPGVPGPPGRGLVDVFRGGGSPGLPHERHPRIRPRPAGLPSPGASGAHHHLLPGEPARIAEPVRPFSAPVRGLLADRDIEALYAHQARAADLVRAGRHVVVATASGKTLVYNLPVIEEALRNPDSKAIYLFPLKALAQDQLRAFEELVEPLPRERRPWPRSMTGTPARTAGARSGATRPTARPRPPSSSSRRPWPGACGPSSIASRAN